MDNWHIDAIIHCLKLSIEGERPRLIINLPPRHLKSFIVSVALPAFILGMDPTAKIICISYSDDLAKTLSRDFRRIVESEWYKKIFQNVKLSKITENEIVTVAGGFRYATSVGGTLTGRGGDFIIIDDPIKPEDAQSEKIRNSTNDWFLNTLLSRLDDKKKSVLILVMQRLHVNDLTGFVEATGGYHKLSFPAIATKDEDIPVSATQLHSRKDGEPLHEERESLDTLEKIRKQIGSYNFASQYQQSPDSPEGSLFKLKWLNIIDQTPEFVPDGYFWVSIDTASSQSDNADYSAFMFGYSNEDGHHVISVTRCRSDYETLKNKALLYAKKFSDVTYIVESAGNGISLIQYLKGSGLRCISAHPKHSKMERAARVLPIIEAGRLYVCNKEGQNNWVKPFIDELVSFPHGRFDDQVDSLTQALRWAERQVNPGTNFYVV